MDLQVEEKLDNLEAIISSFEEKHSQGEIVSPAQIRMLQLALFSIIAHHTIAKWWQDDISERIQRLEPESAITDPVNGETHEDTSFSFQTGLYQLISMTDENVLQTFREELPFSFRISYNNNPSSQIVRVTDIDQDICRFLYSEADFRFLYSETDFGVLRELSCLTLDFAKHYKLFEAD